jgi:hypothetical protein
MKINRTLVWITLAAFTFAVEAQTSAGGSANSRATAQAGQASASAAQATDVSAQLSKKIDSKDAKVGDEVVAKTTSDARLADGTKLPKGSRLVGHVTEVEAKSHDNHDSHLAFAFDHAVMKDGRDIPIHAMMRSISAPASTASAGGSDDLFAGGGMQGGGGGARGGAIGGGGGPVGGAGLANSAPVRGVSAASTPVTTAATGGLNNEASSVDGSAAGSLGTTGNIGANGTALNNAASINGGAVAGPIRPVGNLSGVTFATVTAAGGASTSGANASAEASTTTLLTGHGRNVSLDSGSQMTLGVAPQ